MEAYRPLGVNDRAELRSVRRRHVRLRGGGAHRCRPTWFTRIGTSCNLMLGSHSQIGADDYDRYRAHSDAAAGWRRAGAASMSAANRIRVGIGGWGYPPWRGSF